MELIKKERKQKYINNQYYIYYEIADSDGLLRIITNDKILDTVYKNDIKYKDYKGIMLKFIQTEPNDEVLKQYLADFKEWIYEAKVKCFKIYSVDFTQGDVQAMQHMFFSLLKGYDKTAKITAKEYKWFEKCANNGLMYLRQDDIEVECTTYDKKMCYANILGSDLEIPTKHGKEYTLEKLPKKHKVQCGFYRVKITTDNEDFAKCFVLSKKNVYVDVSLRFALEHKKQFDLKIELIQDDQPNAYLYDETVKLSSMTSEWLQKVTKLKQAYPKNPYIKMLASGTWGTIQQRNKLEFTAQEIEEKKLDVGFDESHKYLLHKMKVYKGVDYYVLVNTDSAYKYQLRVKPWVTGMARNNLGTLSLQYLDHVVRSQTDSVSFDKDIQLKDNGYALEGKTTGLIHFKNVNCYHNKTTGYHSKNYL